MDVADTGFLLLDHHLAEVQADAVEHGRAVTWIEVLQAGLQQHGEPDRLGTRAGYGESRSSCPQKPRITSAPRNQLWRSSNALWSPLFFGLRSPTRALVNILLLWLAPLGTRVAFWKARPIAGAMLVPYLAWVSFATALNFALWSLNS